MFYILNCYPEGQSLVSGLPILQNDRIVGVVTRVLLDDPTRGYGIFVENMREAAG